jgi:hypothetical protein
LKFLPHPLLGLLGPFFHGGFAQITDGFNQQGLHLVCRLKRSISAIGQFEDALNPRQHFRMLAELLNQLDFNLGKRRFNGLFVSHPHCK